MSNEKDVLVVFKNVREFWDSLENGWMRYGKAYETDSQGQVILSTGLFLWRDGTYRNKPE